MTILSVWSQPCSKISTILDGILYITALGSGQSDSQLLERATSLPLYYLVCACPPLFLQHILFHIQPTAGVLSMTAMAHDPLSSLRQSIAADNPPIPTTSSTDPTADSRTDNLAAATHLHFTGPDAHFIPLESPTRFLSSDTPVDLRSIFFAWQKKDVNIPDYIASAQALSEELVASEGGQGKKVQNLVFVERLDLITWLEGASDESEYIKPIEGDILAAAKSAQVASGQTGGVSTVPSGAATRGGKQIDPRLQEIYNLERRMGDRNSVLRGIKPTVRKRLAHIHRGQPCDSKLIIGTT